MDVFSSYSYWGCIAGVCAASYKLNGGRPKAILMDAGIVLASFIGYNYFLKSKSYDGDRAAMKAAPFVSKVYGSTALVAQEVALASLIMGAMVYTRRMSFGGWGMLQTGMVAGGILGETLYLSMGK